MTADGELDVIERAFGIAFQKRCAAHHHSRRTKPALHGVMLDKGLLNRMKLFPVSQTFDCRDLRAASVESECHATRRHFAVDPDRAGRACASIASDFGAGESQSLPEDLDQRRRGIHVDRKRSTIHCEAERNCPRAEWLGGGDARFCVEHRCT